MKCATHPSVDSEVYCGHCGRALCRECRRDVRGMVYCENCLASRLPGPGLPPILGPGPSPGVALGLGFIPGVGAAYNGQVVKGLVQVLIFITLWQLAERIDAFVFAVAAFWIYMGIDAYQTAKRKQVGQPTEEWFGLGDLRMNAPLGASLLIGLGALFLLDNMGIAVFRHISRYWPVILIVIGIILLQRQLGGAKPPPPPSSPGPTPPREGPGNIPGPQGL